MGIKLVAKKAAKLALVAALLTAIGVVGINLWIVGSVSARMYDQLDDVEKRDVALLLGTSPYQIGGGDNPFFTHRITAAADLYHAGKVRHIIVSGESSPNYNEPRAMRKALIKKGVPENAITMDFAGLRTFDSVVRCQKIFQQQKVTIISQAFHNARALFIADYYGLDAIAYNAEYPAEVSSYTMLREYFARPKAVLDLYLLDTQPRHMGEQVFIDLSQP